MSNDYQFERSTWQWLYEVRQPPICPFTTSKFRLADLVILVAMGDRGQDRRGRDQLNVIRKHIQKCMITTNPLQWRK